MFKLNLKRVVVLVYLPDFEYYGPENVPEACQLLARFGTRAKLLAGGTDLLTKIKKRESQAGNYCFSQQE
ncbi:MAG: FAD binding domain-containing protein [Thermincola sp.]|nr:FAD binding domain-containing protein [Thermincola sp.]